jgi:hypothetical protein
MTVPELGVLGWIGVAAVAVVVIGWLVVSFQRPGPSRDLVARVGSIGLYVALLCFFVSLTRRALERDSTAGLIGFGFLAAMFAIGLVVAVARTIGSRRGRRDDVGATG